MQLSVPLSASEGFFLGPFFKGCKFWIALETDGIQPSSAVTTQSEVSRPDYLFAFHAFPRPQDIWNHSVHQDKLRGRDSDPGDDVRQQMAAKE